MTAEHVAEERGSPLDRLLESCTGDRLHIGLALVGRCRLTPLEALTLTWDGVDTAGRRLLLPGRDVRLSAAMAQLLHWHGCRQRVDALVGRFAWDRHGYVVTDRGGRPYSVQRADEATARLAVGAGLPPIPMSALRHPVLQ